MKASILNATHPDYDGGAIARWEALYEGGAAWRALLDEWLPKQPYEPDSVYAARKKAASYANHAGPIVDLVAGMLFADPPTLTGGPDGWTDDVDRQGASLRAWFRDLVARAMVQRRVYAWVNLPAAPDTAPATRGAQEQLGLLTPYLVDLDADEVRNWSEGPDGNLTAILLYRCGMEQADLLAPQAKVHRWTLIDTTQIRRWKWVAREGKDAPGENDEVDEDGAPIEHKFGRLPVVRLALPAGLHALGKLEDPCRALAADENHLEWGLTVSMNPLLVFRMADGLTAKPITGPGHYHVIGSEDNASYVEPGGTAFSAMEARVKVRMEEVYRVVQQMAQSATTSASKTSASAASKQMDWAALETMLESYAAIVMTALRQLRDLLAVPWGVDADTLALGGLSGWGDEDLAEKLAQAALAFPDVKSETFRREVAKRIAAALLDDVDASVLDTIKAEIDAADYSDTAGLVAPPVNPADLAA